MTVSRLHPPSPPSQCVFSVFEPAAGKYCTAPLCLYEPGVNKSAERSDRLSPVVLVESWATSKALCVLSTTGLVILGLALIKKDLQWITALASLQLSV